MVPRFVEPACCRRGDADGWSHHEEGRSLPEDHPPLLGGDVDHLHPPVYPSLLHGLSHAESLGGQSFPGRTVWVSQRSEGATPHQRHVNAAVNKPTTQVHAQPLFPPQIAVLVLR